MNIKKLKIRGKISGAAPKELSLIRRSDRLLGIIFLISSLACMAALLVIAAVGRVSATELIILISAPFFLVGFFVYIEYRRWIYLVALLVLDIILFLARTDPMLIFFISFVFIGAAGVVGVVVLIQRCIFYRVVGMVEYLNVKDRLSVWDKVVSFFFSVPKDMDTRTITMNYNLKRASIPWDEMLQTISLGLMIGVFLWIYMSMNPVFMDATTIRETPAMMFALVLYIPLLVLPWSIFKSLNVRVETRYRDFTLYDGIKETLKRMAVPMFVSFLFVLMAINNMSLDVVFGFILLSVIFNVVIIGLTSLFFYLMFEAPLVDDIVSKWRIFRPVSMSMDIGNDVKADDDIPGTPRRDHGDYGVLEFPDRR